VLSGENYYDFRVNNKIWICKFQKPSPIEMGGNPIVCWTTTVPKDVWLWCIAPWLNPRSMTNLMRCNIHLHKLYRRHSYVTRWNKYTPRHGLYMAAKENNMQLVWYYMDLLSATTTDRLRLWNTGLKGACAGGHLETALKFVTLGADKLDSGFRNACRYGHIDMVTCLISMGVSKYSSGIVIASKIGNLELVRYFVEVCGVTNIQRSFEHACANSHMNIMKYLGVMDGIRDLDKALYPVCTGNIEELLNYVGAHTMSREHIKKRRRKNK
jgi:hypothetical protein